MKLGLLLCLATWLCIVPSLHAGTLYVDPNGELKTVQEAIDAASSGDSLILAAATYIENPIIQYKDLLLRAADGATVILDGGPLGGGANAGSTLRTVGATVQLEDLVVRNGVPLNVGAGVMAFGGFVQMRRCRLEDNVIGALSVPAIVPGVLELVDCEVIGNELGVDGSRLTRLVRTHLEDNRLAVRTSGEVDFQDVEVIRNGRPSPEHAGALALGSSFGRLERVHVLDNWSNNVEGGIWMSAGPFELIDCEIANNTSTNGTAGIGIDLVNSATLVRCSIRNNHAQGELLGAAGLLVRRASVVAENCTIADNEGELSGGGVSVQLNSSLQLFQTEILGNVTSGNGGGLFVSDSHALLEEVAIAGNRALAGGGLATEVGGSFNMNRCTVAANVADLGGAGLFLVGGPSVIERSIIAFHSGQALFCQSQTRLSCVDLFANGQDSDCGSSSEHVLSVDPLFCNLDPTAGIFDLDLRSDSPLAEAGMDCDRLGASPVGCEGVGIQPTTWTRLKSRFR